MNEAWPAPTSLPGAPKPLSDTPWQRNPQYDHKLTVDGFPVWAVRTHPRQLQVHCPAQQNLLRVLPDKAFSRLLTLLVFNLQAVDLQTGMGQLNAFMSFHLDRCARAGVHPCFLRLRHSLHGNLLTPRVLTLFIVDPQAVDPAACN